MVKNVFYPDVYYGNCCGNAKNCLYSHKGIAKTADEFKEFLEHDHTFIQFKGNYRSKDNFIKTNAVVFDCDNEFSDEPSKWIYPENIADIFKNVRCIVYTSRNHMNQKGNKSPRPRFHVIFPVESITKATAYADFTSTVCGMNSFFDDNAIDAGRFFFGNPDTEVTVFNGDITLDMFINNQESAIDETIPEGRRNSTMSAYAGKIIKRYGDTDEAYAKFIEKSDECDPPLDDEELQSIWHSAQGFYKKISSQPGYVAPEEYNNPSEAEWDIPIPFAQKELPMFPIDALPATIRNYVVAVSESTQTPVDMSASAALAVLALCQQGKFRIRGKSDWTEPLNLFVVIVAEPSERKSAVISFMTKPVNEFEAEYNFNNSVRLEMNKIQKNVLKKEQVNLETKAAKGKLEHYEMEELAQRIADFKEITPLRLFVDDVTTEKLTSVLAEGNGKAAIVSAEGGIFDMLSGLYTKSVNIDVMLKGHSGDSIRVDRIGRNSESIMNPALTVLLMVQPSVLSGLMQNGTFRGRGLTARFMYCMPKSIVGKRKYRTEPVPPEVENDYFVLINGLLEEKENDKPELITLSAEADAMLESYSNEVESKLKTEYADFADWAGKLVGAVLRIAGLLCRASALRFNVFGNEFAPLVVDETIMNKAIKIGRYFTEHTSAAFSLMGADMLVKQSEYVLDTICKNGLVEFSKRDIMRLCRTFKTADSIQPVLNHLIDYGYLAIKSNDAATTKGRPTGQVYLVNPYLYRKAS